MKAAKEVREARALAEAAPAIEGVCVWYKRLIAAVFALIALGNLCAPESTLGADGVPFHAFSPAARAEVRAYYFGTALCVSRVSAPALSPSTPPYTTLSSLRSLSPL